MDFPVASYKNPRESPCEADITLLRSCFDLEAAIRLKNKASGNEAWTRLHEYALLGFLTRGGFGKDHLIGSPAGGGILASSCVLYRVREIHCATR